MWNKIHEVIQDIGYIASILIPVVAMVAICVALVLSGLVYFGY